MYLLPFLASAQRHIYLDEPIDANDASLLACRGTALVDSARSAGRPTARGAPPASEEPSVGGLDCVDAALFRRL